MFQKAALLHSLFTTHAAQGAFVVTFGRAGEDKKFSKLGDVEATLQGFAGADYDLQVFLCMEAVIMHAQCLCCRLCIICVAAETSPCSTYNRLPFPNAE